MAVNDWNYDADPHSAEAYDVFWMPSAEEADAIRQFIGGRGPWRILEPFCGTGRLLLPLAQDGHELVGMDCSKTQLGRLREKLVDLPAETQARVTVIEADVIATPWPTDFDLILLGGNCFYVVAGAEEQNHCLAAAAASLKPGGYLFLDNDHMEGDLAEHWRPSGFDWDRSFTCADGTRLDYGGETIWCDVPGRLWRSRRVTRITHPDGRVEERVGVIQKHPPCLAEIRGWLAAHGFEVECANETETRATYWARLEA